MIIGYDIPVRGDDHADAQAMFHPVLRLRRKTELPATKLTAKRIARAEKLLHVRHTFRTRVALLRVGLRCDRYIHYRRCDSRRQGFHCTVEREQCSDTVVIKRRSSRSRDGCGCRLRTVK